MQRIGITGQHGFIGTHLFNTLGLFPDKFKRVPFKKKIFDDEKSMDLFVSDCDVIVHLAGMNRHSDPETIYTTNLSLAEKLVAAFERTGSVPHVIFSSSTQEERDNHYGKSKKAARELLVDWAARTHSLFTGLIIPNVFGPFGHPHYNSVIATFCHQLANNEMPKIDTDSILRLIYVGELVPAIIKIIDGKKNAGKLELPPTSQASVSEILSLLKKFQVQYIGSNTIPEVSNKFEIDLFNTFRSYLNISSFYPVKLKKHDDFRGSFAEIIRVGSSGQVSFSVTGSGIVRGNHFHTRKIERFTVIKGKALISLRRIGTAQVIDFHLDGNQPAYVDMPIWYTHNIKNIGEDELITIFWINEFYNPDDPDTYFETV